MVDSTKIDAFVESSPLPSWLVTGDGSCVYANPALQCLTGLSSEPIDLADWRTVVVEDDRDAACASWRKSLATGSPYRTRVRVHGFDGLAATVELIAFGHKINDGQELSLART
jgi:PAS domain S-box-containing protein